MGSYVKMIDCPKCGGCGYIDDDYKDGIRVTGCDDCGYKVTVEYSGTIKNN